MDAHQTAGDKTIKVLVWDKFVRVFHWSLVLSFTAAYLTAEYGYDEIHEWLGYFIAVLILTRLIWGFVGSKYARFSSFIFAIPAYFKNFKAIISNQHDEHYLGHNPLGGAMVFALLAGLLTLIFSGLILLGWSEYTGPVWAMGIPVSEALADFSKFVHYEVPELMLLLIAAHILGVLAAMYQHGENLVRSMFDGYKNKA
ncbi:MAG: cytochrome b/b6 domain-containing protein [Mariprofundaceae bacterium]|nr:cytochrome b/b6 domain-containing protein [Mariprofundaceae bacterium]